jgi:succinate-acetate transporter protein
MSTEAPATNTSSIADPAPLGLAGFAMTTFMLSFGNAGIVKGADIAVVLGLALFYGGIAQFVAGIVEYRRGNAFGATAFCSFGAFWLSFWAIGHWGTTTQDPHKTMGLFLISWAIFTAYMTLAALKTSGAVLAVFAALTLTFVFLALGAFQNGQLGPDALTKVGGYLGIVTALFAWYASAASVINATHKRDVLPTWPR